VSQEILGFGGAFTEAAALSYQKLPAAIQRKLIELYFGETGIGYSMGRIHIGSCDFCVSSYSFDDVAGDAGLTHFDMTVQRDQQAILPMLRDAIAATGTRGRLNQGHGIRLVASPWSPPAWMKLPVHNASAPVSEAEVLVYTMLGSAKPNGLNPAHQQTWANYMSRFVEAYSQQGVPIWALTPQNEPENAAPWEACVYTPDFQARFVADYLGPTMRLDHPEVS
jgi:glucosylceramidase